LSQIKGGEAVYCEACGSHRGKRRLVEFKDYRGMFDMCKKCYDMCQEPVMLEILEGSTRRAIMSSIDVSPLIDNGPCACFICKGRGDNGRQLSVCMRCHRKVCGDIVYRLGSRNKSSGESLSDYGCYVTFGDDWEYTLPDRMKKFLPFEHREQGKIEICVRCVDEVMGLMVSEEDPILRVGEEDIFESSLLQAHYKHILEKKLRD